MAKSRPDEERQLYCKLEDPELLLKGEKHARGVIRLEDIDARKKAYASVIKLEHETVTAEVVKLAHEIDQKREIRPVQCRWELGRDQWVCHRIDTGEVVDTAPVTMADNQSELFS